MPGVRYFLAAGFALSCLGFMLFLSFFCELLPLPIFESPVFGRLRMNLPERIIGTIPGRIEFGGWNRQRLAGRRSHVPAREPATFFRGVRRWLAVTGQFGEGCADPKHAACVLFPCRKLLPLPAGRFRPILPETLSTPYGHLEGLKQ